MTSLVTLYKAYLELPGNEASRSAGAQSATVKLTGCGFDPHSQKLNIYLHFYFHFLAVVQRQSAALSSTPQHGMPPELGGKWGLEFLNTEFLLPTLLCAGHSVKLIFTLNSHHFIHLLLVLQDVYKKFADDVLNNIKIFEPEIENVKDVVSKDLKKVNNRLNKDNADLIFDCSSLETTEVNVLLLLFENYLVNDYHKIIKNK